MLALIATLVLGPPLPGQSVPGQSVPARPDALAIRVAEVDLTAPEPLPLGGYTERKGKLADPGGDALVARAVLLEQGRTRIAIVSADMLTIPESLYREVAAKLPEGTRLFLQATHSHCAPDSQMLNERMTFGIPGIATFKRRWLTWYAGKVAESVTQAMGAAPTNPRSITAAVSVVSANRTRREGGHPDPRLTSLVVDGPRPAPLLTHFSAHATIFGPDENHARGDWPAMLRKTGGTVVVGAIGDVSPAADGADAAARLADFRKRLSSTDKQTTRVIWRSGAGRGSERAPLRFVSVPIPLDAKKAHPDFAKENGIPFSLAEALVQRFAPDEAQVAAIRLGDLAIVGIPGEPTSILGNQIREAGEKLGFKSVLVCSHVNGWMGYVLDPLDYLRGGYEATLSFYGRQEGEQVVRAAIGALRSLRDDQRQMPKAYE